MLSSPPGPFEAVLEQLLKAVQLKSRIRIAQSVNVLGPLQSSARIWSFSSVADREESI